MIDSASTVSGVFTAGALTGGIRVGPLAGRIRLATLSDAYTHATVGASDLAGGLAGSADGATLTRLYSRSSLTSAGAAGGTLGGAEASTLQSVIWDAEVDGLDATAPGDTQYGAQGHATADMTYFELYTDAGFDFIGETPNGLDDIWDADQLGTANGGYPMLAWQHQADGVLTLFSAGQGTPERPYEISTLSDLALLAQSPSYWDAHFLQTADIDASQTAYWDDADADGDGDRYNDPDDATSAGDNLGFPGIGQEPGYGVLGIGGGPFTGTYDGGGRTLSGLTLDRSPGWSFGLFARASGARIHNLTLTAASVSGSSSTALLVGDGDRLLLTDLTLSGNLSGSMEVGGLAGRCAGCSVDSVRVSAQIQISGGFTRGWVGGLIGHASGLAGLDASIRFSSATGNLTVTGSANPVGGLVGKTGVSIHNSYADLDIHAPGAFKVGGLAGDVIPDTLIGFQNSYTAGDVHGGTYTGGLFGEHSDDAIHLNLYASGSVSGEEHADGVSGFNLFAFTGVANGVFWNTETTGQGEGLFGTALTSSQMRQISTFATAGWDFEGTESTPADWDMDQARNVNNGFPILRWQDGADDIAFYYSGGQGTPEDPYRIATLENLRAFSETREHWSRHFAQTADINASPTAAWNDSAGFASVGIFSSPAFRGSYNGRHHVIDSLHVTPSRGPDNSIQFHGLFGYAKGAVIDSVALRNMVLDGRNYAGGVVGYADGVTVRNSLVTGWVTGAYAGGIFGYGRNSTVENSFSVATVEDQVPSALGGLVGESSGTTLRHVYAAGSVLSRDPLGNLVGTNAGGLVGRGSGTAIGAFWDLDRSGLAVSAMGEGKTPLELTTRATFLDAGWDLQGETANGQTDPWHLHIELNARYPVLAWRDSLTVPQLTLLDPDSVTNFSVTASGSVTRQGGIDVDAYGVIWSRSPEPTLQNHDGRLDGPSGALNFQLTPTRLLPNHTYYIRAFATNLAHTGYSATKSFQTPRFTEGSGTPSDPFRIRSLHDLATLSQDTSLWSGVFEQMNDIDASPTRFWDDSDDDGDGFLYNDPADSTAAGANDGFQPIGTATRPFDCTYRGRGRPMSITGLTMQRTPSLHTGFIGLADGATIGNLALDSADVTAYNHAGILIGSATNGTHIHDVRTSGLIVGLYEVGGVAGVLDASSLERVRNGATVGLSTYNTQRVGGIAGSVVAGSIRLSANHGRVRGESVTGGIAGSISDGSSVVSTYNIGYVDAANLLAGGIASNLVASTLDSTYNAGDVRQGGDHNQGGGLAFSVQNATASHSYYARQAGSALGENVPTDSLHSLTFWLDRGWDLQGEQTNGTRDIWKKPDDAPTPILSFEDSRLTLIVQGDGGFRMLSSPFADPDLSAMLAPLWTQGMEGADFSAGQPNVWTYDGSNFVPIQDLSAASLAAGQGFGVYVFEDSDNDGAADLPIVLALSGEPNPERITRSTPYRADSTGDAQSGWSLIGNPFPRALDISRLSLGDYQFLFRDGVNDYFGAAVHVWDANASTWRVSDGVTGDIPDHRIAPFQSFFVRAATPDATQFTFESGNMTTPDPARFLKAANGSGDQPDAAPTAADSTVPLTLELLLQLADSTIASAGDPRNPRSSPSLAKPSGRTWITFTDGASLGEDARDAHKLVPLETLPGEARLLAFTGLPTAAESSGRSLDVAAGTHSSPSASSAAYAIQALPHPSQWDGMEEYRVPFHVFGFPATRDSSIAASSAAPTSPPLPPGPVDRRSAGHELSWRGSVLDDPAVRLRLLDRRTGTVHELSGESGLRFTFEPGQPAPDASGLLYSTADTARFELLVGRSATGLDSDDGGDLPKAITLLQNVPKPHQSIHHGSVRTTPRHRGHRGRLRCGWPSRGRSALGPEPACRMAHRPIRRGLAGLGHLFHPSLLPGSTTPHARDGPAQVTPPGRRSPRAPVGLPLPVWGDLWCRRRRFFVTLPSPGTRGFSIARSRSAPPCLQTTF